MPDPVTIVLLGQPVPWARAGSKGGHRFTPDKQRNNAATLRMAAHKAMIGLIQPGINYMPEPFDEPVTIKILADVQIPQSWSKRRKNDAILGNIHPAGRPDLSNVVKQVEDALNGVVYTDDARICVIAARKRYGVQPKLVITVSPLSEA